MGQEYTYEKLLIATGGRPRHLPFGVDRIIYFRTLEDYKQLRQQSDQKQTFLVLGGGFIGSEIAAALTMNGNKVVMAFPGEGIGVGVFPADLSHFLNDYYRGKGVEVLTGELISGLLPQNDQLLVTTRNTTTNQEREFLVDGAVAGLGMLKNVEMALAAGLKVENGIVVDASLRTSQADIYAAGDVAAFYSQQRGRYRRVEHEDNSNTMGRLAGRAMAGSAEPYDNYLPRLFIPTCSRWAMKQSANWIAASIQ